MLTLMEHLNILLAPVIGLIIILIDYCNRRPQDMMQKRLFILLICSALAAMLCDLVYVAVANEQGDISRVVNSLACSFYFLFKFTSFSLLSLILEYIFNENYNRLKKMGAAASVLSVILIVSLVINSFTGRLFFITHDNEYVRGDWYSILVIIPYSLMLFILFNMFVSRKNITKSLLTLALISIFPVGIGSMLDLLWAEKFLSWPSYFVSLLFFYLFIMRRNALIDSLTNIYNRRGIDEYLLSIAKSASRKEYVFIMVDMDRFKEINDLLGHAQGDNALRDAAEILCSSVRRSDFVARYGGDEFVVIAAAKNVETIIQNIHSKFEEFNVTQGRPYMLKLSCGGDIYRQDDPRTPAEFLAWVDSLMYAEKERRQK